MKLGTPVFYFTVNLWSRVANSLKLLTKNTTSGNLTCHCNCSGLFRAFLLDLNSTIKKRPSAVRKLSSGMPLLPFFSFFHATHPCVRAYALHCFSKSLSMCNI